MAYPVAQPHCDAREASDKSFTGIYCILNLQYSDQREPRAASAFVGKIEA